MSDVKLNRWKENFKKEMQNLQIEFDAFFLEKKLNDYYDLKVDDQNQTILLEIKNQQELPKDIVNRMAESFNKAKPEDLI